ncbi:hypothetical protein KL86PLE_10057 [uncultured Pleomorphomonas sp.]|uniref:Uncharacterized protein n=1 Tax=uncultured Pleomorphomonas sp. TaxID=442121 RepID=A0A212KY02_9HYPH|nr:hypothetical protein KL86PLE_10057 [uncultured Pleomorphomonas sp.]
MLMPGVLTKGSAPARCKGSLALVRAGVPGLPPFHCVQAGRSPSGPAAFAPCYPGLGDGQGCSAALRSNPVPRETGHVSSSRHPVRPQCSSDQRA